MDIEDIKHDLKLVIDLKSEGERKNCMIKALRFINQQAETIESLKCCGNCGRSKLYSNGQHQIEQQCGFDHECNTSPYIAHSPLNHWQPIK